MQKPCRLELNNSGAWKLLGKFDAAEEDYVDDILNAASNLLDALNQCPGSVGGITMRVATDDPQPSVLMRHDTPGLGWRKPNGDPA